MLLQIVTPLAWLAGPITLLAIVDDWFLRPRRQRLARSAAVADPAWVRAIYLALPVVIIGAILRLLLSDRLDFSLVLVLVLFASGLVWLLDRLVLAPARATAAKRAGLEPADLPLPVTVDYARSLLPSMMPTLEEGDFLVVNKFAFGLRLPVLNTKILKIGEPERGDVVVFHYPPDPAVNFIKRVVGLPGDTVRVHDDQLIINGLPVPLVEAGRYSDGCYLNMRLATEQLGAHRHQTLSCHTMDDLRFPPVASCNRQIPQSYRCDDALRGILPDRNDTISDIVVPAGEYLMIGDNRDNSLDGRFWGFVPEDHLVGRASRIWLNLPLGRSGWPDWRRFGERIE